ncbi:MAG TPA: hypothetical protein VJ142_01445 [Candidatus Nanoarchaeia archaeon]|nr:hypothetical protein [Candidatus Nanoarchaeia archaeon]
MKNKRAQIAETITWIFATLVIVAVLAISLFASSLYIKDSKDIAFFKRTDALTSKSLFSYLLTKDTEGSTVYEQLKSQENFNDFNGNLGKTIFQGFYEKDYVDIWLGMPLFPASNQFFGKRPTGVRPAGEASTKSTFVSSISEKIYLNQDKTLELYLSGEGSIK